MTKNLLVTFVTACALVACGGGSASSGNGTRQGSHPDQGTAAPHIECGTGSGHHGGGCGDGTSGGAATAPADGTAPATTDASAPPPPTS